MAKIILGQGWDAASRNPAGMTGPSGPKKPQEGFVGPKPTLATIATEKRKKADELALIAKQKRQIANDLASKLKAKNLKANAPQVMASRQVGGITGPGGKVVNPVYNTY